MIGARLKFGTAVYEFGFFEAGAVAGNWTIDKTSKAGGGANNGFLDCARSHTPGYMSHGSTQECVNNLSRGTRSAAGIANIVGHGNDGLIVTGTGQVPNDSKKYITTSSETDWGPLLKSLKGKVGTVKLWACHTGTAQSGADLLYAIMQETNATCMAPTGFLNCTGTGFQLEANSTWQMSSPGHPKPAPINAPTPHFRLAKESWSLRLRDGVTINLDQVQSIEWRKGAQSLLVLRDEAAKGVLRYVDFTSPVEVEGILGAVVTASFSMFVAEPASGQPRELKFSVYNNRMVVSDDDRPIHYRCSEAFVAKLISGVSS